jgi:hypothetical protein
MKAQKDCARAMLTSIPGRERLLERIKQLDHVLGTNPKKDPLVLPWYTLWRWESSGTTRNVRLASAERSCAIWQRLLRTAGA